MRVAIYYPWVYLHGGPERTIAELLARSRHSWTVITNRYEPEATFPILRQANVVELSRVSVKRSFLHAGLAALRIALARLPLEGHDALVVFCEGFGDLVLIRNRTVPAMCLCFTPLRAAFDPFYQSGYLSMKGNGPVRRSILSGGAAVYRWFDRRLWDSYAGVIAISDEVRRRIVAGKLYPEDRIRLLHPGVDSSQLVPSGRTSTDFLIPGRIMWTKNLELAVDAFRLLLHRRPDLGRFTLTMAGFVDRKSGPYLESLRQRAADCPQIRFVVAPSDEELFARCDGAYAVLYPPFNEDWGLVPLEAMAFEKPVIAVNRGGPRETVVHGETGLLVENDLEEFSRAIERFADNPEEVRRMGVRARLRAKEFDWARFCVGMDHAVEEMVAGRLPAAEGNGNIGKGFPKHSEGRCEVPGS